MARAASKFATSISAIALIFALAAPPVAAQDSGPASSAVTEDAADEDDDGPSSTALILGVMTLTGLGLFSLDRVARRYKKHHNDEPPAEDALDAG